jgi:cation-transporting ATPase E
MSGLTSQEVAERVSRGLTNAVDDSSSRPLWHIIRTNVFTRFNAILGALFVVVLSTGSVADALFGFPLIINSLVGIIQEYLAKRKLDQLALLHAPTTRVIRDGVAVDVQTKDVVLDDLIELRSGDQVPADGQVIDCDGLEINEANLTGESDAVVKDVGDLLMSGTIVTAGSGCFVTQSVGADSYAHRIAAEAKVFSKTKSEIQVSVNRLLKYITWVIVFAVPLQLWTQFKVNNSGNWQDAVIRSAAGLVGLVPEGLVLLTTLAFLLAAVQLTRQQVLVQELPAVEGLARVSVVCLDKTGTLTTGSIEFEGVDVLGEFEHHQVHNALGALANDPSANSTLATVGRAMPASDWEVVTAIPFNSARKWSASQFAGHGTWILGAPDVLLPHDHPVITQVSELAKQGRRVLFLAYSQQDLHEQDLPSDLLPAAIVTLREDIRPDAEGTLAFFAQQGVKIKIISGDNPQTVASIARSVGLDVGEPVDAQTLGNTPEELMEVCKDTVVFGRVSPEQKRSLVQALQTHGEVVAMTGDGVNDALALKRADIGIAMNNAAPATKAVAQLILLDGKFSHLPSVLAEGRRVIGNVERVANLFVAKNAMSLVAIITTAILMEEFPLLPRHMTLLSTVTIGIPAFFLALAPNPRRYVPGFLKRILRFAVPSGIIAGLAVMTSDFFARRRFKIPDGLECSITDTQQTAENAACWTVSSGSTISVLIVFFWILIVLARPFRLWKAGLVGAMILLAVLAFVLPIGRDFFNFNVPAELFWQSALIGAVGAFFVEIGYRRLMTNPVS